MKGRLVVSSIAGLDVRHVRSSNLPSQGANTRTYATGESGFSGNRSI